MRQSIRHVKHGVAEQRVPHEQTALTGGGDRRISVEDGTAVESARGVAESAEKSGPAAAETRSRASSDSLDFAEGGEDRRVSVKGAKTVENPLTKKAGKASDTTPKNPEELDQAQQTALVTKKALPSLLSFATIIVSLSQTTGMVIDVDIPWPSEWIQVMNLWLGCRFCSPH